jgi:hypothetical protein
MVVFGRLCLFRKHSRLIGSGKKRRESARGNFTNADCWIFPISVRTYRDGAFQNELYCLTKQTNGSSWLLHVVVDLRKELYCQ